MKSWLVCVALAVSFSEYFCTGRTVMLKSTCSLLCPAQSSPNFILLATVVKVSVSCIYLWNTSINLKSSKISSKRISRCACLAISVLSFWCTLRNQQNRITHIQTHTTTVCLWGSAHQRLIVIIKQMFIMPRCAYAEGITVVNVSLWAVYLRIYLHICNSDFFKAAAY